MSVCVIDIVGCYILSSNENDLVPQSWTPAHSALEQIRPVSMCFAFPQSAWKLTTKAPS